MDLMSNVSAIDDSYETVHVTPGEAPAQQGLKGPKLAQEYIGYNGPRSGLWTVKDTAFGSGIDDCGGTAWQVPAARRDSPYYPGCITPLAGDLIKRLAKATEAQKKAEIVNAVTDEEKDGSKENVQTKAPAAGTLPPPQGFYVPKTDLRGIRIAGKDGKKEVVKAPQIAPLSIKVDKATPAAHNKELEEAQPKDLILQGSTQSQKAESVVSRASQRSQRAIRIAGKNGEEVFAYIPIIRPASKAATQHAPMVKAEKLPQEHEKEIKTEKATKAQRDAGAAKVAKQLKEERERQTELDERAKKTKVTEDVVMSGALPASSQYKAQVNATKSPPAAESAKSSAKESKGASAHSISKRSTVPPSAASSKTSIPVSQLVASVKKSRSLSPHQPGSNAKSSSTKSAKDGEVPGKTYKPPSKSQWQEIGSGTLDAPSPKRTSQRSVSDAKSRRTDLNNTPAHSFRNSQRSNGKATSASQGWVSNRSASYASNHRNDEGSAYSSSPRPQQTIFAGRGWISPHPLSVARSEFEERPDPLIKIPSREGATMTYDEWLHLRQRDERRSIISTIWKDVDVRQRRKNISRSSGDAEQYAGGSWGFRKVSVSKKTESTHDGWNRGGWSDGEDGGSAKRYQSPRVESVRSDDNRTYEHNFDGARDEDRYWDGKLQLPMPWDGGNGSGGW